MAARGTGLPAFDGASVTPLVDTSGYGAAERASAEGFAKLAENLGRFHKEVLSPVLEEQGKRDAAEAVKAGRFQERDTVTEYGQAYNDAMTSGTLARFASEDDQAVNALVEANPFDPDAFAASAAAYRTDMLKRTPGALAIARAESFDRRRDALHQNLMMARVKSDAQEAGVSISGRRQELVQRISASAEEAGAFDPVAGNFAADVDELSGLYGQMATNPVLGIPADQAQRLRDQDTAKFQAAGIAGHIRRIYRAQGPDAALAEIETLLPPVGGEAAPTFISPTAPRDGLVVRGNIDLAARPRVESPDGTISTVRSISIEEDGRTVLIPTVTDDGRVVTDDEAVALFHQTGRHLGMFASEAAASAYAQRLHEDQAQALTSPQVTAQLGPMARELAREASMKAFTEENGLAQQRANLSATARNQAAQRTEDLITAMRYGGDVNPDDLRAAAEASGQPDLIARARWAIEVGVQPPEGFGSGTGTAGGGAYDGDATAAGGFAAWSEFFFDAEGGDVLIENDNGRGPSRWGINQNANPDLDVRGLAGASGKAVATRRLRERYWDAIGGDRLPPALAFVAADAAAVAGPQRAQEWIEASHGDVGQFLALQERHYRGLAAADPGRYGDDLRGWLNRMGRARQVAARIQGLANNQDGFATDPIAFAMGGRNRPALAQIAPLPVDAVFASGGREAWGQVMQQRRATAETLASQYQVPRRLLTNGERAAYKDRLERDPAAALALARAASDSIGPQGARDLLAELGEAGTAPTLIHVADIGRPGGDVRFAEQAALGLTLRAQGQSLDADRRDEVNAELNRVRPLLASSPSLLSAVQNSAQAAALADSVAGVQRPADYYVQAALGRTTWGRNRYGGATEINGVRVIVPRWLNGERLDDVIGTLADSWIGSGHGPVFANGEAMPKRAVQRLRPVLQPNGNYRLADDRGRVASRRGGAPFEVNMDTARTLIEGRLGRDVVRPD